MGQNTEDQSGGYCSSGERLLWLHLDRRDDSDGKGTRLDVDTVSKIQPQCLLLERLCGLRELLRTTFGILAQVLTRRIKVLSSEMGKATGRTDLGLA